MEQQAKRPAVQEVVEEARPFHTSAVDVVETCYLSQDRPLESVVWETVSPVHDSAPMEVDPEVVSNLSGQRTDLLGPTFAGVVMGRNNSVFRPTPIEAAALHIMVSRRGILSCRQFQ